MIIAAGYELEQIPARGFARQQWWKNISVLWALGRSILACRRIVRRFKPHVVVGTGGYVTGPVIRAAHQAGVATLIQEQNRRPGLTTTWLSRLADVACVAFEETARELAHPERVLVTGNPIDAGAISAKRTSVAMEWGLAGELPTILITGGSQGAHSINENIGRRLQEGGLPENWQLIWQTGNQDFQQYSRYAIPGRVVIKSFFDDLAGAMAAADLIIARAGALTIAEITARGLPAILVPYPHAAADHQTKNAQGLEEAGAATLITDAELANVDLLAISGEILADEDRRTRMQKNSKRLGRPEATEMIVNEILRLAEGGKRE